MEEATEHAGHALDAIMRIAAAASADLDSAQIEIEDARVRGTEASEGSARVVSLLASLQPH